MASANTTLRQTTAVRRGAGLFVNRTNRNANARAILNQRTGRGAGGRFTITQVREALANQTAGGRPNGRRRRL